MLAVVIPAHNEEALIAPCLDSVFRASRHAELNHEEVAIIVVADHCLDETASIASAKGARVLYVEQRNVGAARGIGADAALAAGARWLSFTDADTMVPHDWLAKQLRCNSDVVCGVITIDDWGGHHPGVKKDFITTYRDANDHRHIHGANLGVASDAYRRAGGFRSHPFNEDVALVEALISIGANVTWSAEVRVTTSARLDARAPRGFGAALCAVNRRLLSTTTLCPAPANTD